MVKKFVMNSTRQVFVQFDGRTRAVEFGSESTEKLTTVRDDMGRVMKESDRVMIGWLMEELLI